jgi:hypothetical protein
LFDPFWNIRTKKSVSQKYVGTENSRTARPHSKQIAKQTNMLLSIELGNAREPYPPQF